MGAAACSSHAFVPPPPSPQRVYDIADVDERPEIVLTPPLRYPDDPRIASNSSPQSPRFPAAGRVK